MAEKSENAVIREEIQKLDAKLTRNIEKLKNSHRIIIWIIFLVVCQIFLSILLIAFDIDFLVILVIQGVFWLIELIMLLAAMDWDQILMQLIQK